MIVKPGDFVTLKHYSASNPIKSMVAKIENDILTVKPTKDFTTFNFFEGDPVVLGHQANGEVLMAGCNLTGVNTKINTLSLKIENTVSFKDNRKYDRYPVSIYMDVKARGTAKKHQAIARNMSIYGIMLCSKADFTVNQEIDIDISMDKSVIFVAGEIIWKMHDTHHFIYGVTLIHSTLHSKNMIKKYFEELRREQEEFIIENK